MVKQMAESTLAEMQCFEALLVIGGCCKLCSVYGNTLEYKII